MQNRANVVVVVNNAVIFHWWHFIFELFFSSMSVNLVLSTFISSFQLFIHFNF